MAHCKLIPGLNGDMIWDTVLEDVIERLRTHNGKDE